MLHVKPDNLSVFQAKSNKSNFKIDPFNYKEKVDNSIKDKSKFMMKVVRYSRTLDAHD